ncbi:MAG: hypothetical protein WBR18_07880 [Anaerolineales bacterium]
MQEDDLTPRDPENAVSEPAEAGTTEEGVQIEDQTQPRQPSRVGRIAARALRWAVGIGVVFMIGVLVTFIWRVRPQSDTIRKLGIDLKETQSQVDQLQSRLDELAPLESENEQLQQELETKDHHLELLAVLVDVTRSQLALAQEQPDSAKAALEGTDGSLQSLLQGMEGSQAGMVSGMRERLQLVVAELDGDTFAAQRDLEIMANNLIDLEGEVFSE